MTPRHLVILLAVALLGMALLAGFGAERSERRLAQREHEVRTRLETVSRLGKQADFYTRFGRGLFNRMANRPLDGTKLIDIANVLQYLGGSSLDVWAFDASGTCRIRPASESAGDATWLMRRLRSSLHSLDFDTAKVKDRGRKVVDGDWRFLALRPNRAHLQQRSRGRTWWFWTFNPRLTTPNRTAGVLLRFDHHPVHPDALIHLASRATQRAGMPIAVVNRLNPRAGRLLPGLGAARAQQVTAAYLRHPGNVVRDRDGSWVVVPCQDHLLLMARARGTPAAASPWGLMALFALMAALARSWSSAAGQRWPVRHLLVILFALAAALPLALCAAYWQRLTEGHERAVELAHQRRLENRLVDIDRHFPVTIRRQRNIYQTWVTRAGQWFAQNPGGIRHEKPRPNGQPTPIKAGCSFVDLVAETEQWERRGLVDTMYLVSSAGVLIRDFSDITASLRLLSDMSHDLRTKYCYAVFDRHGLEGFGELARQVRSLRPPHTPAPFLGIKHYNSQGMGEIAGPMGREMIRMVNRWSGVDTGPETPTDERDSLMLASFMESGGGNIMRQFVANHGDFIYADQQDQGVYMYTQMVANPDRPAQICATLFHHAQILAYNHWRPAVAGCSDPSAPDDFVLHAVSDAAYTLSIPDPWAHRTFAPIVKRLQPPRLLVSDRDPTASSPSLFAALACRQTPCYNVIGLASTRPVTEAARMLRWRLAALAVALGAIAAVMLWRLHAGIDRPLATLLAAIHAMERRQIDKRFHTGTHDELEQLAQAFNRTLEGMAELEVARVIQQKLLPTAAIAAPCAVFFGRSIMTSEVGGDYYDARVDANGNLYFMVGDVSGHGVSAALVVAMAKAGFGAILREGVASPAALLARMNNLLVQTMRRVKMMTAMAGVVGADGSLVLSNAGHCYPFVVRGLGNATMIEDISGVPLGAMSRTRYRDVPVQLNPGNHLVVITDGLVEAQNEHTEQLGYDACLELMRDVWRPTAPELIDEILVRLRRYCGTRPWGDDVTVAVITGRNPTAS